MNIDVLEDHQQLIETENNLTSYLFRHGPEWFDCLIDDVTEAIEQAKEMGDEKTSTVFAAAAVQLYRCLACIKNMDKDDGDESADSEETS